MLTLALQYEVFVFAAACGVIQVAAAYTGLKGLLVLRGRLPATAAGYAVIAAAFAWFFGMVDRNVRGLEGMEQALLFVPSAVCAIAISAVISSLVHRVRPSRSPQPRGSWPRLRAAAGLEALREQSYLDALLGEGERATR